MSVWVSLTPLKVRPKERAPWRDLMVSYINFLHSEILKDLKASIQMGPADKDTDSGYQAQKAELTRAHFVMDTSIRSGLGECLNSEPDLKPLADGLALAHRIESDFDNLERATSLNEFLDTYDDV